MSAVLKKISGIGLIPVIAIDDAADAVPLADALIRGGLPVAEVTFRTDAAEQAIRNIREAFPEMLLGAGTVLSKRQADSAIDAGAEFIVSPGLNPEVTKHVLARGVCMVPGTATPGEMEQAMELGLDVVKFFPAEQSGGLSVLKAVSAAYGGLRFIPTGGINARNIGEYMSFDRVAACGGSWMVPKSLVSERQFGKITALAREAVASMLGYEFAHVGVNCPGEAEAFEFAEWLSDVFEFDYRAGNSSVFAADKHFEIMKRAGRGAMGHIGIQTNCLRCAVFHLKQQGCVLDEQNAIFRDGKMAAIYLEEEKAGFAFHLTQKQ